MDVHRGGERHLGDSPAPPDIHLAVELGLLPDEMFAIKTGRKENPPGFIYFFLL